ncbi:MAG: hypothetical protein JNJ54_21680 [Myxococcaceae bacterium]|nr:hypothetical protein [Myxococcaceae bacterium]
MRVRVWVLFSVLVASVAWAERPFPWTWTSSTQARGTTDVELWTTVRTGRPTPYDLLEVRGWVSAGLLRQVDLHFGLETDVLLMRRENKAFEGRLSGLARYRFLDPDVLGIALLVRAGVGLEAGVLESRLVLDRVFGTLLLAANGAFERTVFYDRRDAIDTRFEASLALRLQVSPAVTAGFEGRSRTGLKSGEYQGTAIYLGPTLSISTKWVWLSVGAVAQVAADKAEGDRFNGQPIIFRDDERFGVRLVVAAPTAR